MNEQDDSDIFVGHADCDGVDEKLMLTELFNRLMLINSGPIDAD